MWGKREQGVVKKNRNKELWAQKQTAVRTEQEKKREGRARIRQVGLLPDLKDVEPKPHESAQQNRRFFNDEDKQVEASS